MINDVPTPQDLETAAGDFLNIAWGQIFSFVMMLEQAKDFARPDSYDEDEYWQAARRSLEIATTSVHLGTELLLKSRIASVSPYLLLQAIDRWPKSCQDKNTSFSDFKTIDAQDLVRVHDTVASVRLPSSFVTRFSNLRSRRNAIVHGLTKTSVEHIELMKDIMATWVDLSPTNTWVRQRRLYLRQTPYGKAFSDYFAASDLVQEVLWLLPQLTRSEAKRYFGFNKNMRSYICLPCRREVWGVHKQDAETTFAQLAPSRDAVYCFVCEAARPVARVSCSQMTCKGNVVDTEEGECLTCGAIVELG